jgi:hypothetical protein
MLDVSNYMLWIQVLFAIIPIIGIFLAFNNRIKKDKEKRGIGKRFIQFISVILIIPTILILAIQGIIEKQLLGGLLGAIIGYTLSY